jgi:hypothetical protein
MARRKRKRELEAFVSASELPQSPGHPLSTALHRLLLAEAGCENEA